MNRVDYDRALYYAHRSQWDNLLLLMVRTEDDLLSKRIGHLLHAYHFAHDYTVIERKMFGLLRYIDHANEQFGEEWIDGMGEDFVGINFRDGET